MNRRSFIYAAVSSLFIPHALVLANTQTFAEVPAWEWAGADWFFHDDRFPQARRLATELSGSTELTPVRGDITGIWNTSLRHACGRSALTLNGVTTESFHFCLKLMVGEQTRMHTRVTRIDRDLFLWQIRCSQPIQQGILA